MTVVLATVCQDGVVLGSDSQITDKGRGMTYPAEKLHPLGEVAAWGGSGSRAVLFDVERCFNENSAAILEAPDIGRALQEHILPILRHHYDTFISDVPGEEGGGTPSAYVMAAGWRDGEPWIIEKLSSMVKSGRRSRTVKGGPASTTPFTRRPNRLPPRRLSVILPELAAAQRNPTVADL